MNENRPAKVKSLTVAGLLLFFFSHTGTQSIQKLFTHLLHSKGQQHSSNDFSSDSNIMPRSKLGYHHTKSHSLREHLQLYCYSRTYPHAHSSINTPYYYNTNTVIQRIYMDAATPYLEDIQRNIIHLHALRAIVICQHDAQEKHKHTAQQQLATMRAHMCVLLAHQHRHTCSGTTYAHFTNGPFTTYTGNIS